jgi:hypothetical protein
MKEAAGAEVEDYSRTFASPPATSPVKRQPQASTWAAAAAAIHSFPNILSIDVEDYYHPTEVQRHIEPGSWKGYPSRVETTMHSLLEAMAEVRVKSTCFILGWLAERHPTKSPATAMRTSWCSR